MFCIFVTLNKVLGILPHRSKQTKKKNTTNQQTLNLPAMFASAYLSNLPAIQQCFSLTTNQQTVLSAMAYQPSQGAQENNARRQLMTMV